MNLFHAQVCEAEFIIFVYVCVDLSMLWCCWLGATAHVFKSSQGYPGKISHLRKIFGKKTNSENILGKILEKYLEKH